MTGRFYGEYQEDLVSARFDDVDAGPGGGGASADADVDAAAGAEEGVEEAAEGGER